MLWVLFFFTVVGAIIVVMALLSFYLKANEPRETKKSNGGEPAKAWPMVRVAGAMAMIVLPIILAFFSLYIGREGNKGYPVNLSESRDKAVYKVKSELLRFDGVRAAVLQEVDSSTKREVGDGARLFNIGESPLPEYPYVIAIREGVTADAKNGSQVFNLYPLFFATNKVAAGATNAAAAEAKN